MAVQTILCIEYTSFLIVGVSFRKLEREQKRTEQEY